MNHNINHKVLNRRVVSLLVSAIITAGCSHAGGPSSSPSGGNPTPQNSAAVPLTIDNAGTYPVIKGNVNSKASVWVHNNSDATITDFNYTKTYNSDIEQADNQKLNLAKSRNRALSAKSSSGCSDTIAPHSSCMIPFDVPTLDAKHASAALDIQAHYKIGNEDRNVDQVVNFAYVDATNESATGVVSLGKNLVVNSLGNKEGYATLYLYGTGSRDTKYKIDNLKLASKGLNVTNGNPVNTELGGGQVVAVEVGGSLLAEQSFATKLDVNSSLGDKSFKDSVTVSADPVAASANVVAGFPSLVDVAKATTGEIYIYNAGSKKATVTSVSSANSKLAIANGSCANGQELVAGASCAVKFTITDKGNNSSDITISYTEDGGAAKTRVVTQSWFNSATSKANMALVAGTAGLNIKPNIAGTDVVTLTNSGNIQLTNLAVQAPTATNGATATVVADASNTCEAKTLAPGTQCHYTVSVTDTKDNNAGKILTSASAHYVNNQGADTLLNKSISINYATSSTTAPSVDFANQPSAMSIVGDNSESKIQTVTLNNPGGAPEVIRSIAMTSTNPIPSYVSLDSSSCTTIPAGGSCDLKVKLGTAIQDTNPVVTSGLKLEIKDNMGQSYTSSTFDATVTPVAVNISAAVPSVSAGIDGRGIESDPYVVHGYSTTDGKVTVTYTQSGSGQIQLVGADALTGNNAATWQLDDSSSCLNNGVNQAPNKMLKPGDSCTIVYKNVIGQNSGGLTPTSNLTSDITLPTLTLRTAGGTDFDVKPSFAGGTKPNTVYVKNSQALISNFMDILNPNTGAQKLKVGSSVSNATGYGPLTVTAKIDQQPLLGLTTDATIHNDCANVADDGMNQYDMSCTLPANGNTVSNTYDFDMPTVTASGGDYWSGTFVGEFDVSGVTAPGWLFNSNDYFQLQIPASIPDHYLVSAGHFSGFYLTDETIYSSTDLASWTPTSIESVATNATLGYNSNQITYLDGKNVFAGIQGKGLYKSVDGGANWSNVFNSTRSGYSAFINFKGKLYEGSGGSNCFNVSTDLSGTSWNPAVVSCNGTAIATNGNALIIGGNNSDATGYYYLYSTDGVNFDKIYGGAANLGNIRAMDYFNGKFWAVGNSGGNVPPVTDKLWTSHDGLNWELTTLVPASGANGNLNVIGHYNNTVIISGSGWKAFYVSPDNGATWTDQYPALQATFAGTDTIYGVSAIKFSLDGKSLVAAAIGNTNSYIIQSTDNGQTWTIKKTFTAMKITSLA